MVLGKNEKPDILITGMDQTFVCTCRQYQTEAEEDEGENDDTRSHGVSPASSSRRMTTESSMITKAASGMKMPEGDL